jgi:hypothetical protein
MKGVIYQVTLGNGPNRYRVTVTEEVNWYLTCEEAWNVNDEESSLLYIAFRASIDSRDGRERAIEHGVKMALDQKALNGWGLAI